MSCCGCIRFERKQGDSVPYTVEISSVAVVDQIRCCRYVDLDHTESTPKRDACKIHNLGWSKTEKETSLEENEKEPEASWDSLGGFVMTNKTVARGEEMELEMQSGPIRVP